MIHRRELRTSRARKVLTAREIEFVLLETVETTNTRGERTSACCFSAPVVSGLLHVAIREARKASSATSSRSGRNE
jgi:hypothetical protein